MKNQLALFIIALTLSNIACSITYEASFKAMAESDDVINNNNLTDDDDQNVVEVDGFKPEPEQKFTYVGPKNFRKKGDDDKKEEEVAPPKRTTAPKDAKKGEQIKFINEDLRKVMESEHEKDDNPEHMHNNKKFMDLKVQIDVIEDKQENIKEEEKDPQDTTKLMELKEKLHKVIVAHNEKYQMKGLKETKDLDSLNHRAERHAKLSDQKLSEEDIDTELNKEDKQTSNRVLPKRLVPTQESFDNGSMLRTVYGTYNLPKRAWYYAQSFNLWTIAYRNNRVLRNERIRLPTSMKELTIEFSFIFVVLSSPWNYSSHSTCAVSIVMDRIKLKEASFTDGSQFRSYGRWIVEKYTLSAKLFNVPSGDHEFRIFARSPNGYQNYFNYAGYYSPYDKRSKLLMIGFPENK